MAAQIRLVMVEDTESDAELISYHLQRSPLECSIRRVQTEPDFVAVLQDFKPDVILSDFSMPQFDGLRALQIAAEQAADTPFIFVSGTIGEERAIDALRRGATDYVLKTNLSRLASAVERAVRESALKAAQRKAEQQLRDNEQRLRDTVETSQDWIWELDAQGRFRFCSGAVAKILGYHPADLLGKDFRGYLHEEELERAPTLIPMTGQLQLTGAVARWRATDGHYRWLERNAVRVLDREGVTLGYRGSDRDITVRREQEERVRRLTRTYRMLSSTSSAILRLHDRMELLKELCRIAVHQGGYQRAVICLTDPGTKRLRPHAWVGVDTPALHTFDRSAFGDPALYSGTPMVCNDLAVEPCWLPTADTELLGTYGYRALAALPLLIDGTMIGVLALFSGLSGVFDRAELAVLRELAANLSFALQYLDKDEALQFLSYYDSLTGLAKRPLFCERLAQLVQRGSTAATVGRVVIVFDVQQLGAINDSVGRHIGDRLIEQISARLKKGHGNEVSAHFGGGTFALVAVATSTADSGETGRVLQNAAAHLFAEPFWVDGHELRPAVRAGIAFYPHDAETADALVQNAEAALKMAREDNERYMLYGMMRHRTATTRGVALESRLAGALDRQELLLHYQPKVAVGTGRIVGLEALLRWQDGQEGLVPPSLFVPLLERSGAINEVGEWVIQQTLVDARQWSAMGLPAIRVAVNVSPQQLRRRDFVQRVLMLTRASPPPTGGGLDIEITESMLMHDLELSMRKLAELREADIGVAIDDFGTGYSSLRLLSRLPVDTLKIDKSFIQNVVDAAKGFTLVSTIVALSRALQMKTVAEGVETAEQLTALRGLGCDQAQGFYFSPPVAALQIPEIAARLDRGSP